MKNNNNIFTTINVSILFQLKVYNYLIVISLDCRCIETPVERLVVLKEIIECL